MEGNKLIKLKKIKPHSLMIKENLFCTSHVKKKFLGTSNPGI